MARAIAELARAQAIEVIHLSERFDRSIRDVDWITEIGPEGWTIISGDTRISRNGAERAAWHESGMTAFFLSDGWSSKNFWVQAAELVRWCPSILATTKTCRPGSGFRLPFKGSEPKLIFEP